MPDTAITRIPLGHEVSYRQSQMPAYSYGEYVADDTDNHDMTADARGKAKLTYGAENPSDKDLVITLYGSHSATAGVGDAGVFLIGTSITASSTSREYDTTDEGFPFYIIRCRQAVAATDSKKITVYANLFAF